MHQQCYFLIFRATCPSETAPSQVFINFRFDTPYWYITTGKNYYDKYNISSRLLVFSSKELFVTKLYSNQFYDYKVTMFTSDNKHTRCDLTDITSCACLLLAVKLLNNLYILVCSENIALEVRKVRSLLQVVRLQLKLTDNLLLANRASNC